MVGQTEQVVALPARGDQPRRQTLATAPAATVRLWHVPTASRRPRSHGERSGPWPSTNGERSYRRRRRHHRVGCRQRPRKGAVKTDRIPRSVVRADGGAVVAGFQEGPPGSRPRRRPGSAAMRHTRRSVPWLPRRWSRSLDRQHGHAAQLWDARRPAVGELMPIRATCGRSLWVPTGRPPPGVGAGACSGACLAAVGLVAGWHHDAVRSSPQPDGSRLAAGGRGHARLWDRRAGSGPAWCSDFVGARRSTRSPLEPLRRRVRPPLGRGRRPADRRRCAPAQVNASAGPDGWCWRPAATHRTNPAMGPFDGRSLGQSSTQRSVTVFGLAATDACWPRAVRRRGCGSGTSSGRLPRGIGKPLAIRA